MDATANVTRTDLLRVTLHMLFRARVNWIFVGLLPYVSSPHSLLSGTREVSPNLECFSSHRLPVASSVLSVVSHFNFISTPLQPSANRGC